MKHGRSGLSLEGSAAGRGTGAGPHTEVQATVPAWLDGHVEWEESWCAECEGRGDPGRLFTGWIPGQCPVISDCV